jgi:hypothetical protein
MKALASTDDQMSPLQTFDAYILCWRPDRFWLIGPFADSDTAGEWASDEANNPADDPNWHVLSMIDPASITVPVVPPTQPMPDDDALWARASEMIVQTSTSDAFHRGEAQRRSDQEVFARLANPRPDPYRAAVRRQQLHAVQDKC